ncbi:MAG TPA: sugar phosphate isomerase/epimerase family protein [Candidatus Hydrogenedentes bacterium]|jgi:sugar phosphate isomerase/epimerase|nr:MAG: Inosose dehydratase [Candidatus Hydrogenedentes bacterium ADurb.Bin170]HNZ48586.1 sugar phosphate isomerase/epimerase family protein [Candidatus Hydrogenedentota bacterium]HOM46944.1 sugar phosphate isomerase/epimerase family protein [Candidatus Hydrogenedentota bacterium]HPX86856.1 sugar phosphate isomerase/epimerase family protein [Candidatus Hydrogenedentota bacterium]
MKVICRRYAVVSLVLTITAFAFFSCACLAEKTCAEGSPEPLRLACRVANYGKFQDQALEHISSMGLRYVFMSIPKAEEAEAVLAKLKALNLEALVVRGDTNLSTDASVDELRTQFETCKRMGVHYMFLSPKRHDAPKEDVYARLRRAGDAAADNDVILVLETHPDLGTNAAAHLETMKAINHPNVRVNFDSANILYYNEGADTVEELKKCIDYVATVEVKDHNGEPESWFFPALGDGIIDFPAFFAVLREHGYTGPVTIEVEGIKGVEWSAADTCEAMEKSVQYLKRIEHFK